MNFGINWDEEQRQSLLEANAVLKRSLQTIARSQAVAVESEQIGTEVISELDEQRERLLQAERRLSDTDEKLNKVKRILNAMRQRVQMNKCVLILIILLEIAILGIIIYYKYIL